MMSQAGGGRPGSSVRLKTGMRLGTAQRMAAQNGQPMQSVGLATNVVVDHRPVTRQGLTGMHTKPLGPGRQIADDKYFVNDLRQRTREIMEETERMKQEADQIEKDKVSYAKYERQYETIIKEVKDLEGELADFNLALDKLRTNTSIKDIEDMHNSLKQRNAHEAKQVDEIFVQTQNQNKKIKKVKTDIEAIHELAAQRMAQLGEEEASEYAQLQDQQNMLQEEVDAKETRRQQLDAKINALNNKLQSKEYQVHQKGLELQKKKKRLMAQREQLEEDTDSRLTPDEMRNKLKEKVKDMNSEIEAQERRIKQLDELVERYNNQIRSKENNLVEAKKHAQKAKKYEAVFERDRKMQEFIDEFPKEYEEELRNKQQLQNTIVALLAHISKQVSSSENLPDAQQFAEMKDELSFKHSKLKNSERTLALLKKDLETRKEELNKINSLDTKINIELKSLKDKMESMRAEMDQFKSEDELKVDSTEAKKALLKEKQRTKKLRDASKHQVQILGQAFDKRKRELVGNETMKRMDALEQKLRTYSSTVFSLSEFISSRKRESDYEGLRTQVKDLCGSINRHIIEQISMK